MIFGSAKLMYVASVAAYLLGSLSDIWLFGVIKRATRGRYLWLRATGSTVISQVRDWVDVKAIRPAVLFFVHGPETDVSLLTLVLCAGAGLLRGVLRGLLPGQGAHRTGARLPRGGTPSCCFQCSVSAPFTILVRLAGAADSRHWLRPEAVSGGGADPDAVRAQELPVQPVRAAADPRRGAPENPRAEQCSGVIQSPPTGELLQQLDDLGGSVCSDGSPVARFVNRSACDCTFGNTANDVNNLFARLSCFFFVHSILLISFSNVSEKFASAVSY